MTSAKYGTILTDAKGYVLYTYTADQPGGSGCTGSCLVLWPPLVLPAGVTQPVAGAGVAALGSMMRPEGLQVTWRGQPLYTYLDDRQPGQITGQGVKDAGGVWLLATVGSATAAPSGTAPTGPPTTQPPATATPAATHGQTTNPPATQPAVTAPPATAPATTNPPTTQPPATTTPPTTAHTTPPTTAPGGGVSY